eukprot:COSAG02_NODE_35746_length_464_cov_0.797260_1_plen_32_part_01
MVRSETLECLVGHNSHIPLGTQRCSNDVAVWI